ncbi:MAG: hypothetical protein IJY43_05560 [Clostridia bacterium]|nr:hypothetical protein [Clostridia bacterium]
MRYKIDHDFHIHSHISSCSHSPEQTNERILQYAVENGLSQICLTDHFWDESVEGASNWYKKQDYAHIAAALDAAVGRFDWAVSYLDLKETDKFHISK